MNHDIHNLIHWVHVFTMIAAVGASIFPIVYAFSPWWSTLLGRILMFHGISLALALDLGVVFFYWTPGDILVEFWISVAIYSFIAIACFAMSFMVIRINYLGRHAQIKEQQSVESNSASS